MRTFFLLFILLSFNCFKLVAQNPYSYGIDKSSGLPSNAIYDVFQDKNGFMWFATGEGLSKYDGTKFTSYITKNQTSKSGSNIIEDTLGRIWYINFDGYLYYVQNNQLVAFQQKNSIGYYEFGILGNYLFTIQKNYIEIFNIKNLQLIKKIKFDNTLFKTTHISINHFYIFTDKLLIIDANLNTTSINLPHELVTTKSIVVESNLKDLFIVAKTDGNLFTFSNENFKKVATLKNNIIQNLSYVDNSLWLATTSGLFEYKNNTFKPYFKEFNVSGIFKDHENKYWISSLTNGLFYIPNFSSILWICKQKPITLDSQKNAITVGYENDVLSEINPTNFKENIIYKGNSNHEIYKIFKDEKNYFITSNNFKIINNSVKEINNAVKDIVKIDDKYYAFAASGLCGLFSLHPEKKSEWDKIHLKYAAKPSPSFNESRLLISVRGKSVAYNAVNKTIYFATNIGLFCQNLSIQKELKYKNKTFYCQKLYAFNNEIYVFSNENEILKIDQNNIVSIENNIKRDISEEIKNIKLLKNDLFIFAKNTIYQYNLINKKTIRTHYISPDISVTDIAILNNKTILATSNGLILKQNTNINGETLPKFYLNTVLVNNQHKKNTNFEYFENNLSFDFSVLAYLPNSKFPISYKINDANWVTLEDNQRSLKLSSLATGEYFIQFKIENLEKTNKNIIKYNFKIQKPFWEKTNFILLCIVLLGVLFYLLYQSKIKKIEQKNQIELNRITLENNLNQSKLTAIKSQMNPHFFYNALNTIQSYILSNDKKEAITYLNKFSSLTRIILELTERNYLSINEEIKTITLYLDLEKARFLNDFNYSIIVNKEIDTDLYKIPTMLLQPFIENAIKHGLLHLKGNKILTVVFQKNKNALEISIDDNGIGRKRSEELNASNRKDHISFATHAIDKRLEILNKNKTNKITIQYIDKLEFEESIGTTVLINIPTTWK